jgi:predicted Rdx family selenoprotein
MKKYITIIALAMIAFTSNAQIKLDDFGRIILNAYLPDDVAIPTEAKNVLLTKLNQLTSNNGMGGSQANPRFIITANINVATKDILAGPPQMIAQNIEVTFFIGDAVTNTIFSNATLSLKGVGTNENKAFIEAFKTINPNNKEMVEFLNEGKNKIVSYYASQCDFMLRDAATLAKQNKFDEAIYNLSLVPQVCEVCFNKTAELIATIYQQKIDADCKTKLSQARIAWAGQQNISNAENALNILIGINPNASCYHEVMLLTKEINNKLLADEKAQFELALKKYNDKINLEKKRIKAYKEIAIEYAKSQPKILPYNTIIWR